MLNDEYAFWLLPVLLLEGTHAFALKTSRISNSRVFSHNILEQKNVVMVENLSVATYKE
jgi:hypothetical protein